MKVTERKQKLAEAMAKASVSLTDEELAIMDRYRLSPDNEIWMVMPIYDADGRRDISDEEREMITALKDKLKVKSLIILSVGDERL